MERKGFPLKLKTVSEEGSFVGWAAVYNNLDLGGDIIQPGAFAKTLKSNPSVPVLWQHRTSEPLGVGRLSDGGKGLQIEGVLVLEDPTAQRALAHLKAGSVRGLSIGFDVVQADSTADGRLLKELRVWEVSLATLPMNEQARVTAVKSLSDVLPLLAQLTRVDLEDAPTLGELRAIERHLKRLLPAGASAGQQLVWLRGIDAAFKRLLG